MHKKTISPYIGRFAPSPSGPLHFGSLIAAVGSYLQARSQAGKWLLRIEDIDPPREIPGAADAIRTCLEQHALLWDGEIRYQSQQGAKYQQVLAQLAQQQRSYYCQCSRKQVKAAGGIYPATCRNKHLNAQGCAIRFVNLDPVNSFTDKLLGRVNLDARFASEDFIIRRRDGLYAYHLAVVVDDIDQGVNEIVRGADLLAPTACQLALYKALGATAPNYVHLPVAASRPGFKLSKQNHAKGLDLTRPSANLCAVLHFLGMTPPEDLAQLPPAQVLHWARQHWHLSNVPAQREIVLQ